MFALLSKRLEEGYARGETGFILHGIPRTRFQAVSFFSYIFTYNSLFFFFNVGSSYYILTFNRDPQLNCVLVILQVVLNVLQETLDQIAQIDLVVNLKCSEDHLVNRNETALPQQEFLGSMLHSPVAINARRESVGVYAQEVLF